MKPREFWIVFAGNPEIDMYPAYRRVSTSSKKLTLDMNEEEIHVIEYSAYEGAIDAIKSSNKEASSVVDALRKQRDEYRAALEKLSKLRAVIIFAEDECHVADFFKPVDEALAKYPKESHDKT